jgi:hypothetical protein
MAFITHWKPGKLVILKEPYKPEHPDDGLSNAITAVMVTSHEKVGWDRHQAYEAWTGFTHGMIVEIVAHDPTGYVLTNVSLHLSMPLSSHFPHKEQPS